MSAARHGAGTNHEARAVTEGIKFGANMWIHQFDFKTPSERGCPLTYVNTVGPHGQSGRLGEATAGLHGLIIRHLKAWGCPPHS